MVSSTMTTISKRRGIARRRTRGGGRRVAKVSQRGGRGQKRLGKTFLKKGFTRRRTCRGEKQPRRKGEQNLRNKRDVSKCRRTKMCGGGEPVPDVGDKFTTSIRVIQEEIQILEDLCSIRKCLLGKDTGYIIIDNESNWTFIKDTELGRKVVLDNITCVINDIGGNQIASFECVKKNCKGSFIWEKIREQSAMDTYKPQLIDEYGENIEDNNTTYNYKRTGTNTLTFIAGRQCAIHILSTTIKEQEHDQGIGWGGSRNTYTTVSGKGEYLIFMDNTPTYQVHIEANFNHGIVVTGTISPPLIRQEHRPIILDTLQRLQKEHISYKYLERFLKNKWST